MVRMVEEGFALSEASNTPVMLMLRIRACHVYGRFTTKANKRPEFTLDTAMDVKKMNDITMASEKTGLIILGGGIVKHHICNSNMMRNGADYAVYINNAAEFDASDAGARPDEAVSWGKILPDAKTVKVFGDATILFPLVVAGAFMEKR